MPWRPLPRIAFAICTYPFQPSSPDDLPLEIGDELYIIEQGGADGAWYRGYLVAPPSLLAGLTSVKGQTLQARVFSGIFPRCCVDVREVLGEDRTRTKSESLPADSSAVDTPPRTATYRGDGQQPPNGVVTPTETESSTSANGRTLKSLSKVDFVPNNTLGSKQTSPRSVKEGKQVLPLSPVSVGARDPDAPKPPAPVPMLKIGDETPTSAQEPLVDEIASCLREWHSTKLHELLLARRYGSLDKLSNLVQRLDVARRQLLHHVLTDRELSKLRESTVWDLVKGNKILSREVIVRSPQDRGRILTADDSAVEVTRLQSMMSLLHERPVQPPDVHNLHHLYVQLKNSFEDTKAGTVLSLALYHKLPGQPATALSESQLIDGLAQHADAPMSIQEDKMRSLFTDLSSTDIGEGPGAGSSLYVVFKVIASEPVRATASSASSSHHEPAPSQSSTTFTPSGIGSMRMGGRRSLMFGAKGQRSKDGANPERPNVNREASHASSASKGSDTRPLSPTKNNTKERTVKRYVGIGVLRVDAIMRANSNSEHEVTIWSPSLALSEEQKDSQFDDVVKELFPSSSGNYRKCSVINKLRVDVHAFSDPQYEALIQRTPTLMHDLFPTQKMGFSGAPTKPRSDIYLTLKMPFLPRNALLAHPKSGTVPLAPTSGMANLQLTLEVRRMSGDRIDGAIHPSGNSSGHTAWRTPAVERGQSWNITIRLAISPEDVPGSHIVMSIADSPEFPFALAWMPLWTEEAFIRDGEHSLSLYKYDEYTSSVISGKHAYMTLPWTTKQKDETVVGPMAALQMRTYLCSTMYSQDPNLLGLLKWREQGAGDITRLLKRFVFVPEIEIVKLLNETFDALFEILVEYAGGDEQEDLVFNALVILLGLVHDRRFKLGPLVDNYAEKRFKYPFVTSSLIRSFIRLLSNPTAGESAKRLRATFKVGRHVFQFIMHARRQQKEKEAEIGITSREGSFMQDLKTIFKSLEALMTNDSPIVIGTKTLLVQNFHHWLPELSTIMKPMDILNLASSFVDSCSNAQGKLVLYKLVLIIHFSEVEDFKLPETRSTLVSNTVQWLAPHWGEVIMVNEQWRDQVRLCCSVVASQADDLGEARAQYIPKLVSSYRAIQFSTGQPKSNLSLLFPTIYPFPTTPTTAAATFDESLTEISALLADLGSTAASPVDVDVPADELSDFLYSTLQVYLSLLDGGAFPSSWLSVHIYHHKAIMRALEKLSETLIDQFIPQPDEADSFNTEIWRAFFNTLLKLVGSDALALETFPEQKRRAVWKIAGDVRDQGAALLRRTWDAVGWEASNEDKEHFGLERLGGFQVQYVPGLVAPIVELCLSVHEGLRSVAIEVLQTMIVSEWILSQDLAIIQAEMIDCLDELFKSKQLTESIIQKLFIGELLALFDAMAEDQPQTDEPLLNDAVKAMFATIDELLDLLVAVHSAEAAGEAYHIMDRLHLMEFLKDMQKEDIYIRYVHQLAQIQADKHNYTEAGLALRLHADLYDWDPSGMVDPLEDPWLPSQTSFDRKESLYFKMIKYYEEGRSWENALAAYLELAEQYESNTFDFAKLARTQRAMATIYERISKGERQNPRYFRVVYKGLGFPVGLRDKHFVFEGSSMDRMATFTDRMQQLHPAAQILAPGDEEDLEGQYLQIFPVYPQKDLRHPILQRGKVTQSTRDYYLLSRPRLFTSAQRRQNAEGPIREQTVERTVYTTLETFPTILRRSEIVEIGSATLDPLQTAIERTIRKTAELAALEKRASDGQQEQVMAKLTEALMHSVEPTSESTVALYRDFLPTLPIYGFEDDDDDGEEPVDQRPPPDPLETALRVALIDHALVLRRCLAAYNRPANQATRADLAQRFEITFAPEIDALAQQSAAGAHQAASISRFDAASPTYEEGNDNVSGGGGAYQDTAAVATLTAAARHSKGNSPSPRPQAAATSDGRASRQEKSNRLSLTFRKRASQQIDPQAGPGSPMTSRKNTVTSSTSNANGNAGLGMTMGMPMPMPSATSPDLNKGSSEFTRQTPHGLPPHHSQAYTYNSHQRNGSASRPAASSPIVPTLNNGTGGAQPGDPDRAFSWQHPSSFSTSSPSAGNHNANARALPHSHSSPYPYPLSQDQNGNGLIPPSTANTTATGGAGSSSFSSNFEKGVGSVKKRLSALNLGRKNSSASSLGGRITGGPSLRSTERRLVEQRLIEE